MLHNCCISASRDIYLFHLAVSCKLCMFSVYCMLYRKFNINWCIQKSSKKTLKKWFFPRSGQCMWVGSCPDDLLHWGRDPADNKKKRSSWIHRDPAALRSDVKCDNSVEPLISALLLKRWTFQYQGVADLASAKHSFMLTVICYPNKWVRRMSGPRAALIN